MAKLITCPEVFEGPITGGPSIFLAGGISNCPDWQVEAIRMLQPLPVTLINPRRADYDMNAGKRLVEEQIKWEHKHLYEATQILFWFPKETLCPITLFELGAHLPRPRTLWIGVEPGYQRAWDVEIQTHCVRPRQAIFNSLTEMCATMVSSMT